MARRYSAEDISVLSAMEGVRRAPGMYVGGTGAEGTLQCVSEVIQNSKDELIECRGGLMRVVVSGDVVTVADEGRGIPVDVVAKTGKSALETVLTHIHAGSKSGDKTAYGARTFGVHGVGVSAVCALSSSLTAWSFRSGKWWRIDLSEGRVTEGLRRSKPPFAWRRGTIIRYRLDSSLMPAALPLQSLRQYLNILRHFDPLNIEYSDGNRTLRMKPRRPQDLLEGRVRAANVETLLGPVDFNVGGVRAVLAWTTAGDCDLQAHVAGSPVNHGTHVQGLEEAVAEAFAAAGGRAAKGVDARLGMMALLDVSVDCPSFSGQVKNVLKTASARSQVHDALLAPLQKFLRKNRAALAAVVEHATKIGAIDSKSRELKNLARAVKGPQTRLSFPPGFIGAFSFPPEKRELYIVEGESAAGCFTGDTLVLLSDGRKVRFDQIEPGAVGLGFDGAKAVDISLVNPHVTKYVDELIEVELSDGSKLRVTPDHLWLMESGEYVRTEDLTEESELRVVDSPPSREGRGRIYHEDFLCDECALP